MSSNIGKVVQVIGTVVDVEFPQEKTVKVASKNSIFLNIS